MFHFIDTKFFLISKKFDSLLKYQHIEKYKNKLILTFKLIFLFQQKNIIEFLMHFIINFRF